MLTSLTSRFAPSWLLAYGRLVVLLMVLWLLSCQHLPSHSDTVAHPPEAETVVAAPEPSIPPFQVEANPVLTRWAMQIADESPTRRPRQQGGPPELASGSLPRVQTLAAAPRSPVQDRQSIRAAIGQATIYPSAADFDRAVVRFPYVAGALYHLDIGTDAPVLLLFPPGEEVLLVGGLDAKRFLIREQLERVDGDPTRYLVIAYEANACGRLTIATVKGDYLMEVCSHEKPGLAAVAWKHPTTGEPTAAGPRFPAPGLYRVGYRWDPPRGKAVPVWNPVWIGDSADKGKTLILFPKERLTTAAPILLVNGPGGTRHVTNGRGRGQWYEVDRQFQSAELRVGHDEHAEVVTISQGPLSWVRCPGDPGCPPPVTITENPR